MKRKGVGFQIGAVLCSLGMVLVVAGCAGKRVTSTSGDESLMTRGKGGPGGGVESVREDQLASVEPPSSSAELPAQRGMRGGVQASPSGPGTGSASGNGSAQVGKGAAPITDGSSASLDGVGLGDIFFDFDQYVIRKDAIPVLEGNGKWLRNKPGRSIMIEGHCDERGTEAYNLVLGEKRARATKRYLENLGIPTSRIQITSYGEVRPFCKEHNEGCWQQNRRAHFVVE